MIIVETIVTPQQTDVETVNFVSVPGGGQSGQVLTKNSNVSHDVIWADSTGGGADSATNLSVINRTATALTVASSTGADAVMPLATGTLAGIQSAADKAKSDSLGTSSTRNAPITGDAAAAEVVLGSDSRLTDSRAPTSHAHVIADVTGLQSALDNTQPLSGVLTATTASFTTALDSKLAGIEAGADVTDAANVAAAGAVMESDYSPAHSVLVQQSGTGSPTSLHVANNTLIGRLSGGGSEIDALTPAQVRGLINVADGATANSADAALLNRSNHTGTQASSTISDFAAAADARVSAAVGVTVQPLDGDLTSLAAASATNSIYYRSAANTWAPVTIGSNITFSAGTLSASAGGVTDGDKGDITVATGGTAWTVDNDAITNAKMANVPTATIKGRNTAGTGDPEDMTVAQVKTLLNLVGTNTGDQTIALTGDVTGSGTGSFAATIASGSVTLAKQANLAANSIIGNNTGLAATPVALTPAQTTAMLDTFTSSVKGLVPASGGGTTNFLRADGTFAAPPGGGGSPGGTSGQAQFNNAGAFGGASTLTFASSTAGASFAAGTATAGTWPTFAAGTPLTTPVKGTFEHDTNCLYFTTDDGNRGYIPVIHYTRLASNFALTNSTAEQPIFPVGQRTLTLETGIYRFYGNISLTGMSATTGNMAIDILGAGSAVVGQWMWTGFGRDATNNSIGGALGGSCMTTQQTGASFTSQATATDAMAQLAGIFIVTTAGTITPSTSLLTASAASTVAGSFFMVERIGAATATILGQWS